jgi:D-aminopeptidase
MLAFSTAVQRLPPTGADAAGAPLTVAVTMLVDEHITPLYDAAVEATEAAIVNALLAAGTMTGRAGHTAHGLEPERLLEALGRPGP